MIWVTKPHLFLVASITIMIFSNVFAFHSPTLKPSYGQETSGSSFPYVGVDMRGWYTAISQLKNDTLGTLPPSYYDNSFNILSQAGMNHVRYTLYWEGYIVNRTAFINELQIVANAR